MCLQIIKYKWFKLRFQMNFEKQSIEKYKVLNLCWSKFHSNSEPNSLFLFIFSLFTQTHSPFPLGWAHLPLCPSFLASWAVGPTRELGRSPTTPISSVCATLTGGTTLGPFSFLTTSLPLYVKLSPSTLHPFHSPSQSRTAINTYSIHHHNPPTNCWQTRGTRQREEEEDDSSRSLLPIG